MVKTDMGLYNDIFFQNYLMARMFLLKNKIWHIRVFSPGPCIPLEVELFSCVNRRYSYFAKGDWWTRNISPLIIVYKTAYLPVPILFWHDVELSAGTYVLELRSAGSDWAYLSPFAQIYIKDLLTFDRNWYTLTESIGPPLI